MGLAARVLEPRVGEKRLAAGQRFYEALHGYRDQRAALAAVFGLALAVQIVRVGTIWMLVKALGLDVPITEIYATGPVLFAALVLPVSLNGIGVREAVFVSFLHDSTTAEQAIALGVAFFAVGTATSLVGALILALRWVRYGMSAVRPRTQIDDWSRTAGQRIAGYRLPQDDEAPIGQVNRCCIRPSPSRKVPATCPLAPPRRRPPDPAPCVPSIC